MTKPHAPLENKPATIQQAVSILSSRSTIRLAQALNKVTQNEAGEFLELSQSATSRIVNGTNVKSINDAELMRRLFTLHLPRGALRDCLIERAFLTATPADQRHHFASRSEGIVAKAREHAAQARDKNIRIALNIAADSLNLFIKHDRESMAIGFAKVLDERGSADHAIALRESIALRCRAEAQAVMANLSEITTALSWSEWSNVSPDLDDFGVIKLFVTREATAVANASLLFLYAAENMDSANAGDIRKDIVNTATSLSETSFAKRNLEIGEALSDPRYTFNAAATLARVPDKLVEAAEALHLTTHMDGHIGSHLDYYPAWMRVPVGAQKHMRAPAITADRLYQPQQSA